MASKKECTAKKITTKKVIKRKEKNSKKSTDSHFFQKLPQSSASGSHNSGSSDPPQWVPLQNASAGISV